MDKLDKDRELREKLRIKRGRPSFPQRHPYMPLIISLIALLISFIRMLMILN